MIGKSTLDSKISTVTGFGTSDPIIIYYKKYIYILKKNIKKF